MNTLVTLAALALGAAAPPALAPSEIVAAAPASDWVDIAVADLLVMDLAPDRDAKPRRVVIQLMRPPFSQGWIGNIRKLAAAHWWDATSINRVQDNYVVQWGDPNAEDKAKAKRLPDNLVKINSGYESSVDAVSQAHEIRSEDGTTVSGFIKQVEEHREIDNAQGTLAMASSRTDKSPNGWHERDSFSEWVEVNYGWPIGVQGERTWPIHCYGMVGVGRDMPPDTGSGAELYVVIGHAPRHLDRNIALVGRVVEGIEHLSSLPRGTGDLGFYKTPAERTGIRSIRLGTDLPAAERPRLQYLSTESASFARYADARTNRRDPFFIVPAGGADICNIPVPIRRKP